MALTATKFTSGAATILTNNMHTDTIKIALTNTEPSASQTVFDPITNHPPPAAANGYTTGGHDTQNTVDGNKVKGVDITITATAGGIGPFRYLVMYDDTTATDELLQYYDYGSSITLANAGDNIVLDIDATNGMFSI